MEARDKESLLLKNLAKANVLWKEEGKKTYIASKTGTYVLNEKATFIWRLVGKDKLEEIIRLYVLKFGNKEGVLTLIKELLKLGFLEDLGNGPAPN